MSSTQRLLLSRHLLAWLQHEGARRFEGATDEALLTSVARAFLRARGGIARESDVVRFLRAAADPVAAPLVRVLPDGEAGTARVELTARGGDELRRIAGVHVEEALRAAAADTARGVERQETAAAPDARTGQQPVHVTVNLVQGATGIGVVGSANGASVATRVDVAPPPAPERRASRLELFLRSFPGIVTATAVWLLGALGVLPWEAVRLLPALLHGSPE